MLKKSKKSSSKKSKKGKPKKGSAGRGNPSFAAAAKLIVSSKEQDKFLDDPDAYLESKKLSVQDVLEASSEIKKLVKKKNTSKNWW